MNQQPPQPLDPQQANALLAVADIVRRMKIGANNFYWIAGLSVVNSFISAFGGGVSFVIGLGLTQIVDALAMAFAQQSPNGALVFKVVGLVLSVGISSIFIIFGYFAGKGKRWAFITGMVLYGLDALILLVFTDWIGLFFHLYFLWSLWSGLQALNQLEKLRAPAASQPVMDFPKDIGG